MDRAEIKTLLEAPIAKAHPLYPFIYVGYNIGARSGELKELKVKDIDIGNRRLVIARSYCAKAKMAVPTKSGYSRNLPLNNNLCEFLANLIAGKKPEDYVLPRHKEFISGAATKSLNQLQLELGIKKTNFHSIRASFITHLFQADVNLGQIQLMVGHVDLKTTQRYIRFTADDLKGKTSALELNLDSMNVPVYEFAKALTSLA